VSYYTYLWGRRGGDRVVEGFSTTFNHNYCLEGMGCVMVFNATFNNISVISWQSVLLVEGTGENH
jgi:hypothetical protein